MTRIHITVGLLVALNQVTWCQSRITSGKSVLVLQVQILRFSSTVVKILIQTISDFVFWLKISKTIVTSKSGTSFSHNSMLTQPYHVQNTKNCQTKTLIRVLVLNVLQLLCKGQKQTLKLTFSCLSSVK